MKKIIERIRSLFKKKNDPGKGKDPETARTRESIITAEINALFSTGVSEKIETGTQDDDLVIVINNHINDFGVNYYHKWGLLDGRIGTRDFFIARTAASHATSIANYVNSKLSGRVNALTYAIDKKEEVLAENLQDRNDAKQSLDDILEERKENEKNFNMAQSLLYIFFGVLMVVADIVVSLNLAIYFGIGKLSGTNGVADGLWAKVTDYELLLFSLGIAFCTVYVKILYDDYINNNTAHFLKEKHDVLDKNSRIFGWQISLEFYVKLFVKLLIFAGLMCMLYYMAEYRTFSLWEIKDDAIKIKDEKFRPILLYCYIGISLIIPVISGIALSVGFKILAKNRLEKKYRQYYKKAKKTYRRCYEEIIALKPKEKELQTFCNEWEDEDKKVKLVTDLFAGNYYHGFKEGYRLNPDNDLYKLIEEYRDESYNIAFSKKITSAT